MNDDVLNLDLGLPWEENGTSLDLSEVPLISAENDESIELEIYKKARNFEKLTLVSGNSIDCPLAEYIAKHYGKEGKQRYNLAVYLLKSLGFIASDDVMLFLSCTSHARVVIATAGAGKTTSLQLDLVISQMLDAIQHNYHLEPVEIENTGVTVPCILYLNYNKHNVAPILQRYKSLCAKVNKLIVEDIPDDIESSTVHAFCHKWLKAFSFSVDIPELKIISDDDKKKLWEAIALPRWKKYYDSDGDLPISWETLDSLYQYKIESMMDWDDFFNTAKFIDVDLKDQFVKACIKKYESMKKSMGLMDFTDYLLYMIKILDENDDLRTTLQSRYKIIVVDENQDFTSLMNALLLRLYNPALNRIIIVGDPDQTIYQFKGVSPDNVVDLYSKLDDVTLLGLDTNYRCPDNIVNAAKNILDMNILRFKKPINTVKTGGIIKRHPVSSVNEQVKSVISLLKRMDESELAEVVIAYRNNKSSVVIGEELYYANIPFSVIDAQRPFNNIVFKHIHTALEALRVKDDANLNKCLYRFMPVSKAMWEKILDANYKLRHTHFHDLVIPKEVPTGTGTAMSILLDISLRIDTSPCSDYIGPLISLYRKYYFDFLARSQSGAFVDEDINQLWLERTVKFWSRPYSYEYMITELKERNIDRESAVTLSTFHGLKGLEFDYVYAIDFNDNIFPDFFSIEQKYPINTALSEKESENRLCYVLVTRARKELHLFYLETDPSVYVEFICKNDTELKRAEAVDNKVKTLDLGESYTPVDINMSKLRFIQRLTNERGK